jgi:hypothetical protein
MAVTAARSQLRRTSRQPAVWDQPRRKGLTYRSYGEYVTFSIDVNEQNLSTAWGARVSELMDFSEVDRTPMYELNEIVWRSVKGADSPMPAPVRGFVPAATPATR